MSEVAAEARKETFAAYRRWQKERLFDPGLIAGMTREHWDAIDRMYWSVAIGVIPDMESDFVYGDWRSDILVGICLGVQNGWAGMGLAVEAFEGRGVTTYRSPLNLEYIHVLSEPYQKIARARFKADEPSEWAA